MHLLRRAGLRYLLGHRWQVALAVLGITLGVAVVTAVDLANRSALQAFQLSADALTGEATHSITAGSEGFDEALYPWLRVEQGERRASPVVEGYAEDLDQAARVWRMLGVDAFAESEVRPGLGGIAGQADLALFMGRDDHVLMLEDAAAELDLQPGDRLRLRVQGRERAVVLGGTLATARPVDRQGLHDVLIMDIAAAQALLGRTGRLDRIDLVLPDEGRAATLAEDLPDGVQLRPAEARSSALLDMSRAFRLNLTAFSLLALLVGAFLIYNAMTFAVVQRRALFGRLRALGVDRVQILRLVLLEAAVVGLVGSVLGLVVGWLLAQGLVGLVTRTINDLYFVVQVRGVALSPHNLALGLALGMGATLVAALLPANEAARSPPRATLSRADLEGRSRARAPRLAGAGVGAILLGSALLLVSPALLVAFVGIFLLLMGAALMVPWLVLRSSLALARPAGALFGLPGRMAARGLSAGLSRSAVAVAALMIAISTVVGVGVMVDSFRGTFERWLDASLAADVYIAAPSVTGEASPPLAPGLPEAFAGVEGVERITTGRYLRLARGGEDWRLRAYDLGRDRADGFMFREGDPALWARLREEDAVLVTEPFQSRHGVGTGDSLTLPTPAGERSFTVVGVTYDYTTSEGAVIMAAERYRSIWEDETVNSVAVHAAAGTDTAELVARLRSAAGEAQALRYRPSAEIRQISLDVFDRTFTITHVLRLLATGVAVVGVLGALLALALERSREMAVLRAMGCSVQQVRRLILGQSLFAGGLSGLLALPLGLALAVALTQTINQRAFGWSLGVHVDPLLLLQAVALAVLAALLAGWYPARRMAATPPGDALREEVE
ncbi:putative ABC transport system permease protein [Alkalispirillum mobile]|uniref:Putative ABC transport system permease protein n=1 Tax=Alkalispirillum mobile TaxID=85925 RepID=A0A498CCZ2_9GAMM|nr:FtsX-like permease family protein [Alkalispirillum mobile]RLK50278.1 putative ABC transport system permease protein [Alkalispirillum mobile]